MTIHILGRPASKKNSKRIVFAKGRHIPISSKAYLAYEEAALWQLKSVKERFTGPVRIDYSFHLKGKLDADCDNLIASINDILQKSEILHDDKQIVAGTFAKDSGYLHWESVIEIEEVEQ